MSGVIAKFVITSMVMLMAPVAIMYGFYHQIFPGSALYHPHYVYVVPYLLYESDSYEETPFYPLVRCDYCVSQLSSSAQTLASGYVFLAVISVNLVIGFYIYMAMKETPHKEP